MGMAMILAISGLSGCMGSMDLLSDSKVDRSIATSTVPGQKNAEAVSDEMTVSNAVTSADVVKLAGQPLPWANASTGSAGVISAIQEQTASSGGVCRQFQTSRHSYRGISNYRGRACLGGDGRWQLTQFQEVL